MSGKHLRQVCERHGVRSVESGTSLSEPVSGHIHHGETTDDAEERITRAIARGGGAGRICGGVMLEPEYMRGAAEGSSGTSVIWLFLHMPHRF